MREQLAEPVKHDGQILKNQALVLGILSLVFPSLLLLQVNPEKYCSAITEGCWWQVGSHTEESLVDFSCIMLPLLTNGKAVQRHLAAIVNPRLQAQNTS